MEGTPETKCSQATSCRGRSTPTPACPRPQLQPVHRTQIPVHGYHTTTGPPFIRPCKGGLCVSPGTPKGPPRSPFLSAFRLPRLDGRQTTPSTRRERRESSIDRPADPWQSRRKDQKADSPGPMSCRGLSHRELHTPIPASTSNCSLRCSPNPQLPFLQLRPIFRNRPIHKLLAKTAPTSLFSCHFQVQNSPRLVFRELTPIPVHGYDTTSGPFAPISSKGRTRASSHIRHGVPPHDPSDSAAGKPAVTAGRVLTPARRREI